MSKSTRQNLEHIRSTLQEMSWSYNMLTIKAEYNQAVADEEQEERARIDAENIFLLRRSET